MSTLVIGLGNPLCADDGAGLAVLRLLHDLPPTVRLVEGGCPGLGLLDLMAGARKVLLVDAVISGARPGTIHRFGPGELPPRGHLPLSLHGVNAVDALQLGRAAGLLPPEVVILGIEIADRTPFREGLTPAVAGALPILAAAVRHECL